MFVGTNHPNMEETGSLENPIPSGKCYLDLSRAEISEESPFFGPLVRIVILEEPWQQPLASQLD